VIRCLQDGAILRLITDLLQQQKQIYDIGNGFYSGIQSAKLIKRHLFKHNTGLLIRKLGRGPDLSNWEIYV
jgi:hypothetical protein